MLKCINGIRQAIEKLKKKLFWNIIIRYSLQSYLTIGFVCIPAMQILSSKRTIEKVYVLSLAVLLILLPLVYGVLLYLKRELMMLEVTKERYGSLYIGIRHFSI